MWVLWGLCMACLAVTGLGEYAPSCADLGGVRYDNKETGTWDVGWGAGHLYGTYGERFPKGIEGLYIADLRKEGADMKISNILSVRSFTGKKDLRLHEFGVGEKGIRVPRLGVSMDLRFIDGASGDYRWALFADNGRVQQRGWRRGGRGRLEHGNFRDVHKLLDSCELDSDGDGFWKPEVVGKIDTCDVPAGLGYAIIIPATWFAVPAPRGGAYRTLRFDYLAHDGKQDASIPLREDILNPDGSLKIGFVYVLSGDERDGKYMVGGRSLEKVYIVQSCRRRGVIIALMDMLKDGRCLQVLKGTLRVSDQGESIRPRFGKKISYYQMASLGNTSRLWEFRAFGYSRACNTLTTRIYRSLEYPHNLVWDDPYVRRRTREDIERWQPVVDMCKRYGLDFVYEMCAGYIPDFTVLYPQFVAENYDRQTGRFTQHTESPDGRPLEARGDALDGGIHIRALPRSGRLVLACRVRGGQLPFLDGIPDRRVGPRPHADEQGREDRRQGPEQIREIQTGIRLRRQAHLQEGDDRESGGFRRRAGP